MEPVNSKRIKNLILFISFILVLWLAVSVTYKVLKWKDTTGDYYSSIDQLYNTENNLMDVVFVGSSHIFCDIYPCFLWEKYGIASFDMAVSGQDKDSAYHQLKELLKTQQPKVVFVDLFPLVFDKHLDEGNLYRNLLSMKPSINSYSLVKDYFADEDIAITDYLFRWPIIHTRYNELKRLDFEEYKPNAYARGESFNFRLADYVDITPDYPYEPAELSERNLKWLNNLYELSAKEGFELVLIKTPFYAEKYNQKLIDGAKEFADTKGIKFIDFNKLINELGLDTSRDYLDSNHTNANGAWKVSQYVADYIDANYDLPDHRGDARYYQWDKDLDFYYHKEFSNQLINTESITDVTDMLSSKRGEDYTIVISIEHTSTLEENTSELSDGLSYLGFNEEDICTGGKWIYKNRTLIKLIDNDSIQGAAHYDFNNHDTLCAKYTSDGAIGNVLIGYNDYSNIGSYISIVVYDNELEEVVVNKKY